MGKTVDESAGEILEALVGMEGGSSELAGFFPGEVLRGTKPGLKVACRGQELDTDAIWLNPALPVRDASGEVLYQGDRVVLLTQDGQDYYLVCRVVRA